MAALAMSYTFDQLIWKMPSPVVCRGVCRGCLLALCQVSNALGVREEGTGGGVQRSVLAPVSAPGTDASILQGLLYGFNAGGVKETKL